MAFKFPVEAGHIMFFARAVGDDNQVYYDADYAATTEPGGIIAPPTFVEANNQFNPDYALRPRIGEPWFGSGRDASGAITLAKEKEAAAASEGEKEGTGDAAGEGDQGYQGSLHAEQHYEYHRHPRPGDVLTVEGKPGKTWEKQGRRAGKLHFMEWITEYRDQNGELVVTARSVGVKTERPVDSE